MINISRMPFGFTNVELSSKRAEAEITILSEQTHPRLHSTQ